MYLSINITDPKLPVDDHHSLQREINREVNYVILLELCAFVALPIANDSAANFG